MVTFEKWLLLSPQENTLALRAAALEALLPLLPVSAHVHLPSLLASV